MLHALFFSTGAPMSQLKLHMLMPPCQLPGSASLYPNGQINSGRKELTSKNMEEGLTGSQSWLTDETEGCTLGPTWSWQGRLVSVNECFLT